MTNVMSVLRHVRREEYPDALMKIKEEDDPARAKLRGIERILVSARNYGAEEDVFCPTKRASKATRTDRAPTLEGNRTRVQLRYFNEGL